MNENAELLTEAAGVKVIMTPLSEDSSVKRIILNLSNVNGNSEVQNRACGFHLTKSKWDPHPWVGHVENGSVADLAGLRAGDCLLSIDDRSLLGLKIKEIANLLHSKEHDVQLSIWRCCNHEEKEEEVGIALKGPLPEIVKNLANAVAGVIRTLECPVCLESAASPVSQCVHGHILCFECRPKTSRCPICRVRLGQGRCLLADRVHKVFRDVFDIKKSDNEAVVPSLRERLFGKRNRKREICGNTAKTSGISKPRQLLLTKLLFGGIEKAASTGNLTTEPPEETLKSNQAIQVSENLNERLRLHDRTKSASTGELSDETNQINGNSLKNVTASEFSSTTRLTLSLPQTPVWGGSVDSLITTQLLCPLSKRKESCKDIVSFDTLLDHLSTVHTGPQIHFHSGSAKLPFPLPFDNEAIYMLHHEGNIFFLECEEEAAWVTSTSGRNNTWEWSLHGWGMDGTEIKLRKIVISLEAPLTLTAQHIAPLPKALLLHTINVQLLNCQSNDIVTV